MKLTLLLFVFLISRNTLALYGSQIESSKDSFVVSLHLGQDYFCSGVLISPTKVLTAGHCIEVKGAKAFGDPRGFIYSPEALNIKIGQAFKRASQVRLAPTYFEGFGMDGEDLALIELESPVKEVPIKLARLSDLGPKMKLTMIARNKKVQGKLADVLNFRHDVTALILDKSSGACIGDSGGALTIEKNGQQVLAGILIYSGGVDCREKESYGYFPKEQF